MADDSFADLDVDTSSDGPADTSLGINYDDETHVVGPPPNDDYSDDVSIFSGDSELDLANETEYIEPTVDHTIDVASPPQPLPHRLISAETPTEVLSDLVGYADHFVKLYFTASLCSAPLLLRTGYTPEDVDKCVRDMMKMRVTEVAAELIGSQLGTLMANSSALEACHALAKMNWLKTMDTNGMFYPVLPDAEKEMVEQLIDGAENCRRHEDIKKKEAEIYPSEEAEVRAMFTYNMICELMVAVMAELQRNVLIYTDISNGFEHMVTGQKYTNILTKYKGNGLELDKDERWNSKWFSKYTNRSTLKKFVTMPKFSGIVADNRKTSEFQFREQQGNVRLFDSADIKEVRDRWNQGNNPNIRFDRRNGNRNGHGTRDNSRGPGPSSQANRRPADPNYRPPTLSGGIENDGGIRRTDNSAYNERRRYDSPSPPPRRNRSPSPPPSPPPIATNSTPIVDPFAGPSAESTAAPAQRAPMPSMPSTSAPFQEEYSSTECEVSSVGSYSADDSDTKRARNENRERRREKKLKKTMQRKANPPPAPVRQEPNRFAVSLFPTPENDTTIQSEAIAPSISPPIAPPITPPTAPPMAPPPTTTNMIRREPPRQMEPPPLAISTSRFDEDCQTRGSIPYHPMPGQMAQNRRKEEEERRRKEHEEAERQRSMHLAAGHFAEEPVRAPSAGTSARAPVKNPMFVARQEEMKQQRAQPPNEPVRAGGLGSRGRNAEMPRQQPPPPPPQQYQQQYSQEQYPQANGQQYSHDTFQRNDPRNQQNPSGNRVSPNEYIPGMQPYTPTPFDPPMRSANIGRNQNFPPNDHFDNQNLPPRNFHDNQSNYHQNGGNYQQDHHQVPPRNPPRPDIGYQRNSQSFQQNFHQNPYPNQNQSHQNYQNQQYSYEERHQNRPPMGGNHSGYNPMRDEYQRAAQRDDCYSNPFPPPSFASSTGGGASRYGESSVYNPHTAVKPEVRHRGHGYSVFSRMTQEEEKELDKTRMNVALFIRCAQHCVTTEHLREAQRTHRLLIPNNLDIIEFIRGKMAHLIKSEQKFVNGKWTDIYYYDDA